MNKKLLTKRCISQLWGAYVLIC